MNHDLANPCPHCGAAPGQRCTTRRGRPLAAGTHAARLERPARAGPIHGPQHRPGAWPYGTHPETSAICQPDCPCNPTTHHPCPTT